MTNEMTASANRQKLVTQGFLVPFILITSLFFLWGIAHGMLDTLNKHFQDMLHMSKAQSGMIQFSVYMAYFGMALPAGYFMKRFGYKRGIILGLSLFSSGAFLIAATTTFESFWISLYVCSLWDADLPHSKLLLIPILPNLVQRNQLKGA